MQSRSEAREIPSQIPEIRRADRLRLVEPQFYSISEDQFDSGHSEELVLQAYEPGTRITRANFTSFLIQSFEISVGNPEIEALFMKWIKLKYGFDSFAVIANFVKAGGWEVLSDGEKEEFQRHFNRFNKHTEKWTDKEWDAKFARQLLYSGIDDHLKGR